MSLKISKAPKIALFPAAGSKTNRNKRFVSDNAKTSFGSSFVSRFTVCMKKKKFLILICELSI